MVATLSISGKRVDKDCSNVLAVMKRLGITGDVTPNISLVDGDRENGCRILIASQPFKQKAEILWKEMQREADLTCAHVSVRNDTEEGCVLDVFRPSICPGKIIK